MNKNIIVGVAGIVLLAGGFYGGVTYTKSARPADFGTSAMNGPMRNGGMGAGNMRTSASFITGEVISKDATSITIKMQDNSTKIILMGSSTQIMKTSSGSIQDLVTNSGVTVTGSANTDGSITAQSVQIRPKLEF